MKILVKVVIFFVVTLTLVSCKKGEEKLPQDQGRNSIYKWTSDTSYYYVTSNEGKFATNGNFLNEKTLKNIPLKLGGWRGREETTQDKNILYLRYYRNIKNNNVLYLSIVNGQKQSKFHTPEVCYLGVGWKLLERSIKNSNVKGYSFPVRYAIAEKGGFKHLILYWYIWSNSKRDIRTGMTMFRISVRVNGTIEQAEKSALDFIEKLSDFDDSSLRERAESDSFNSKIPSVTLKRTNLTTKQMQAKKIAIKWLENQIVPNKVVPSPNQNRRNLILSYKVPKESKDYKYVYSKSSIYDNALAIIAFSMVGKFSQAEKIIEAAHRVLSPGGDLWFTFNTHNSWPDDKDNHGAVIRSGASAWLGYAITFYLNRRLIHDKHLIKKDNLSLNFLKAAISIADKILERQVVNKNDNRYGFFTGGEGSYQYKLGKDGQGVIEEFVPTQISWVSIEHNIDIYFFLRDLGHLTGYKKYNVAANTLKESLTSKSWNRKLNQFNRGQRAAGADTVRALDCASWGSMFLKAINRDKMADKALFSSENYKSVERKLFGYRPYLDILVYEDYKVNKAFFPKDPKRNWSNVPMIWTEGSLGVAMAYLKLGYRKKAIEIIDSVLKLQTVDGGVKYADRSLKFMFSENPSVAGTAWLVMVLDALENKGSELLFWGRDDMFNLK